MLMGNDLLDQKCSVHADLNIKLEKGLLISRGLGDRFAYHISIEIHFFEPSISPYIHVVVMTNAV